MKKLALLFSFSIFITIIFISSCKKNSDDIIDPTNGLTKLTEGFVAGAAAKIEIYTKGATITSGYAKLYFALYDSVSGKRIDDAHIRLAPQMDMGTMKHAAPFENPAEEAVNHLFTGSVTFVMSSMGGSWTVTTTIHNHSSGKEGSFTFPVTVNEPSKSKQKSFTALHDGNKYFISLIEPSSPKVGINDMEIVIYKKVSMMSWPADSSLSVVLTPEMPTMGHGSPNNINPVHIGNGHYKGKVNFTMTGLWKLNLDFTSGGAVADSTQYFEVEF